MKHIGPIFFKFGSCCSVFLVRNCPKLPIFANSNCVTMVHIINDCMHFWANWVYHNIPKCPADGRESRSEASFCKFCKFCMQFGAKNRQKAIIFRKFSKTAKFRLTSITCKNLQLKVGNRVVKPVFSIFFLHFQCSFVPKIVQELKFFENYHNTEHCVQEPTMEVLDPPEMHS